MSNLNTKTTALTPCSSCYKPPRLCLCKDIQSLETRIHVLILQHPQEPDHELGTARLANLALPQSKLKIGLSWKNLSAALGQETKPSEWAVLYLGSQFHGRSNETKQDILELVDKKGSPLPDRKKILDELKGIVVLDGSWSQAKALWWRNPWLLKLRRAVLIPAQKSLYGNLRHEPRKECLSTIESIALCLSALGEPLHVRDELILLFKKLISAKRAR